VYKSLLRRKKRYREKMSFVGDFFTPLNVVAVTILFLVYVYWRLTKDFGKWEKKGLFSVKPLVKIILGQFCNFDPARNKLLPYSLYSEIRRIFTCLKRIFGLFKDNSTIKCLVISKSEDRQCIGRIKMNVDLLSMQSSCLLWRFRGLLVRLRSRSD